MPNFNQRAYGCALIKAVNSNYNADFSHRPRTLPDGTAYATDKALKYMVRNYWVQNLNGDRDYVLYWKRLNATFNPLDLNDSYSAKFKALEKGKGKNDKSEVLGNLLKCLDVRTFGATFANKQAKISLSIHGPLQISHGLNRYPNSTIYAEQISSPFADQKEGKDAAEQTTLGTQYKIDRAYYAHHISLNPANLTAHYQKRELDVSPLDATDVEKIQRGILLGPTLYDSAAKSGTESALLLWVTLKPESQLVLPSFVEMIEVREDETVDLSRVAELLARPSVAQEVETIELHYDDLQTRVENAPAEAVIKKPI